MLSPPKLLTLICYHPSADNTTLPSAPVRKGVMQCPQPCTPSLRRPFGYALSHGHTLHLPRGHLTHKKVTQYLQVILHTTHQHITVNARSAHHAGCGATHRHEPVSCLQRCADILARNTKRMVGVFVPEPSLFTNFRYFRFFSAHRATGLFCTPYCFSSS